MNIRNLYIALAALLSACGSETAENKAITSTSSTAPTDTTTLETTPAKDTTDSLYMIVPGESIGQVEIGSTAEQVSNILSKADSGDAAMGKAVSFWLSNSPDTPKHMVAVYSSRSMGTGNINLRTRQVLVTSPRFTTPDGISTGSTMGEIRQQYNHLKPVGYYPDKQQKRVYIYDDAAQGITFEITETDSTCAAIAVHEKGESMANGYLPIHLNVTWLNQQ
ncbi:hypothetical protein ACFSKU_06500 [Pontibacter silvestris]|uniref:Lipoprotein n=1 Tax=Pontibacter silvestris TaxID=2305183 RepID=A0ABW4WWZ0_9BACT|nr:hypothetical protein [Pontibacter silvestris]MCC9136485.1 hypothetical protein [Pontibacter silvestris]